MTAALESGVFQQARAKSRAAKTNTVGLTVTKVERASPPIWYPKLWSLEVSHGRVWSEHERIKRPGQAPCGWNKTRVNWVVRQLSEPEPE